MRGFFTILFVINLNFGFCQNLSNDSVLFARYIDSAKKYEGVNPVLAKKILDKVALIDKKKINPDDYIESLFILSDYYFSVGNPDTALKLSKSALKIAKHSKKNDLIANAYTNLATIYGYSGDNLNEIKFYNEAIKYLDPSKNTENMGNVNFNLCLAYMELNIKDSAFLFLNKAYSIYLAINSKSGMASCYGIFASDHSEKKQYDLAEVYYKKQILYFRKANESERNIIPFENIGRLYLILKKYDLAKNYIDSSMMLAKKLNSFEDIYNIYLTYSTYYYETGQFKLACDYLNKYGTIHDSIFTSEYQSSLNDLTDDFEREKTKLKFQVQELEAKNLQKSKLFFQIIFCVAIALFVVIGIVVYRRQKNKQKAYNKLKKLNLEIARQKDLVVEKQKEITDSINYAKRIQYSLLAHDELLNHNLPQHFILFNPKDIVSGDFYWATNAHDSFYLAVCDSTGHGVPGAFMSLLNISYLNEAVIEKNIVEPNAVLNHVRLRLINSMEGAKDGMDGTLIRFEKNEITYASAHNHPVLIRNSQIVELGADKMPIGKGELQTDFTLYTTDLQKNDMLYFYTDGYADQFGGPKGKKFKYKNLNELLLKLTNQELFAIQENLEKTFDNWKGDLEQVDDVCIIGIRI